jgi:hypothetical protein
VALVREECWALILVVVTETLFYTEKVISSDLQPCTKTVGAPV